MGRNIPGPVIWHAMCIEILQRQENTLTRYVLPDLPYKISALEPHVSAEALQLHHKKHHAAYVQGINNTLDALTEARHWGDYSVLNQLQKNLAFHLSGHVMHSIFWKVMSPDGGGAPVGTLRKKIDADFGSLDAMRKQMSECALSLQGSGWASVAWEPLGQRLVIEQVYDHQGNTGIATVPLLVLDMWEHAYYLQYRNENEKWVKAFWDIVNWADVQERWSGVSKMDLKLARDA
jgi:Fe-Mn family superoxide dismutase